MIAALGIMTLWVGFIIIFMLNSNESIINGLHAFFVNAITVILTAGFAAAVFTFLSIPVNLRNISMGVLGVTIFLAIRLIRKRRIAKIKWDIAEIACVLICNLCVIVFFLIKFRWNLEMTYGGIDPANYFKAAMELIRTGSASGEYLTDLVNAMFIQWSQCFLPEISSYKGMTMAHLVVQLMSIDMFWVLVSRLNNGKCAKWINTLISLLYFGGFQLCNLMQGNFFHWEDGILIIMYLIYYVILLQQEKKEAVAQIVPLLLGGFGLLVCYPFFIIFVFPILLPEAIVWMKNHYRTMTLMAKGGCILAIALMVAFGLFFSGQRISFSVERFLRNLQNDGTIYREPYLDFIFFIPIFVTYIILLCKKKQPDDCRTILRMNVVAIFFLFFWFIMYCNQKISAYYYYRMYYILWLLAWLMVAHAIKLIIKSEQMTLLCGYAVFYALAIILSVTATDKRLWNYDHELFAEDKSNLVLCPIFANNAKAVTQQYNAILPASMFETCDFVNREFENKQVPVITSTYMAIQGAWYSAITDITHCNEAYRLENTDLQDILQNFDEQHIEYVYILKNDPLIMGYYDGIFSKLEVVREDEYGYILKKPEIAWGELKQTIDSYSFELEQICYIAKTQCERGAVMVADETALQNTALFYRSFVGEDTTRYVGEINAEEFISKTYIFNIDEVEYLSVLKDSEMYRLNKEYFDRQNVVYENDTGMIVTYIGDGWMPSQQK